MQPQVQAVAYSRSSLCPASRQCRFIPSRAATALGASETNDIQAAPSRAASAWDFGP
jgi:hypothetical protein